MSFSDSLANRVRTVGRGFAVTAAVGAAAGTAAAAYGWWEKDQFEVRHETLPILPEGFKPLRVLHLSDIHFVPGQDKKTQWLQSLADLKPDLVVNTGDNLSHAKAIDPLIAGASAAPGVPGRFRSGFQRLLRPADQESGGLFPWSIQAQDRTHSARLAQAPLGVRHGRLDRPHQPCPVSGAERACGSISRALMIRTWAVNVMPVGPEVRSTRTPAPT